MHAKSSKVQRREYSTRDGAFAHMEQLLPLIRVAVGGTSLQEQIDIMAMLSVSVKPQTLQHLTSPGIRSSSACWPRTARMT